MTVEIKTTMNTFFFFELHEPSFLTCRPLFLIHRPLACVAFKRERPPDYPFLTTVKGQPVARQTACGTMNDGFISDSQKKPQSLPADPIHRRTPHVFQPACLHRSLHGSVSHSGLIMDKFPSLTAPKCVCCYSRCPLYCTACTILEFCIFVLTASSHRLQSC